jgi:hypothetical protein
MHSIIKGIFNPRKLKAPITFWVGFFNTIDTV